MPQPAPSSVPEYQVRGRLEDCAWLADKEEIICEAWMEEMKNHEEMKSHEEIYKG